MSICVAAFAAALTCLAATLVVAAGAQQPSNNDEFARRQYDSGMTFLRNHRYAEALKDLQAVVDSFGSSSVAPSALLQIAQYQLEVARDVTATQTAIDRRPSVRGTWADADGSGISSAAT